MKSPTAGKDFLRPSDVARLLGCSALQVRRLAEKGRLPGAVDLGLGADHEWRSHRPTLIAGLIAKSQGAHSDSYPHGDGDTEEVSDRQSA